MQPYGACARCEWVVSVASIGMCSRSKGPRAGWPSAPRAAPSSPAARARRERHGASTGMKATPTQPPSPRVSRAAQWNGAGNAAGAMLHGARFHIYAHRTARRSHTSVCVCVCARPPPICCLYIQLSCIGTYTCTNAFRHGALRR